MRLIRPIYCNGTSTIPSENQSLPLLNLWDGIQEAEFLDHTCLRLQRDTFGEKSAFRNGMSISDLMRAHAAANSYRDRHMWNRRPGYCFHGDWVLGYYFNFYLFGAEMGTSGPGMLPYRHMDASLGYIYGSKSPLGNCWNEYDVCPRTAHVCHRQNASAMLRMFGENG